MMRTINNTKKKESPFQLFFLKNDETQSVEATEVNKIDFEEVKRRLERGESVYITCKRDQKPDVNFIAYKTVKDPWYLRRS